jgi:hypothetical protein
MGVEVGSWAVVYVMSSWELEEDEWRRYGWRTRGMKGLERVEDQGKEEERNSLLSFPSSVIFSFLLFSFPFSYIPLVPVRRIVKSRTVVYHLSTQRPK